MLGESCVPLSRSKKTFSARNAKSFTLREVRLSLGHSNSWVGPFHYKIAELARVCGPRNILAIELIFRNAYSNACEFKQVGKLHVSTWAFYQHIQSVLIRWYSRMKTSCGIPQSWLILIDWEIACPVYGEFSCTWNHHQYRYIEHPDLYEFFATNINSAISAQ